MIQPSKAEDPTIALELWTKLPQTFSKDLGGGIINRGSDGGVSGSFTCCKFFWVEHCRSCPIYNQPQVYKCPLIQAPGFASFVTLCLFFTCSSHTAGMWCVLAVATVGLLIFLGPSRSGKFSLPIIWFHEIPSEVQAAFIWTERYTWMGLTQR